MLDRLEETNLQDVKIDSDEILLLAPDQEQKISCCDSIVKAITCLIKGPENIVEGLIERVVNLGQKINLGERAAKITIIFTATIIMGEFIGCLIEQNSSEFNSYGTVGMFLMVCPGRMASTATAVFAAVMSSCSCLSFCVEGSALEYFIRNTPRLFLRANFISTIVINAGFIPQFTPGPYGLSNTRVAIYECIACAGILLGGAMSKLTQHQRRNLHQVELRG